MPLLWHCPHVGLTMSGMLRFFSGEQMNNNSDHLLSINYEVGNELTVS